VEEFGIECLWGDSCRVGILSVARRCAGVHQASIQTNIWLKAVEEGITLVYEELALPLQGGSHPYCKPGYEATGRCFSISRPIPNCERSSGELSSQVQLRKFIRKSPVVRSDIEVRNLLDLDFVCFGGPFSNIMTETCMANSGNRLVIFDQTASQF